MSFMKEEERPNEIVLILSSFHCKYMKIIYVHYGRRNGYKSDPSSYEHHWTTSWNKAWK